MIEEERQAREEFFADTFPKMKSTVEVIIGYLKSGTFDLQRQFDIAAGLEALMSMIELMGKRLRDLEEENETFQALLNLT